MTICLHGTSADNLPSILKDGLTKYNDKLWTVSEHGVYFFHLEKYKVANGYEDEDEEDLYQRMLNDTVDQAMFALGKAKDCRAIVIEVDLDEDEIQDDLSCEGMDTAVVSFSDIPPDRFKKVWVSNDLSLFKGYFLGMNNRPISNVELSELELRVAECFDNHHFDQDEIVTNLENILAVN